MKLYSRYKGIDLEAPNFNMFVGMHYGRREGLPMHARPLAIDDVEVLNRVNEVFLRMKFGIEEQFVNQGLINENDRDRFAMRFSYTKNEILWWLKEDDQVHQFSVGCNVEDSPEFLEFKQGSW